MHGKVFHEAKVRQPANKVWDVYGTDKLAKLATKSLSCFVRVDNINGDGGEGTVCKVTFPSGIPGFLERVTKIDNEKRLKVTEVIEGGFLDMGFQLYRVSYQVIEKTANVSIVKTTVEYELEKQFSSNVELLTTKPFEAFATLVDFYLRKTSEDE